jgi:hypothetical protein
MMIEPISFVDIYSKDGEMLKPIPELQWINMIDKEIPYILGENPFHLKTWKYINENLVESCVI